MKRCGECGQEVEMDPLAEILANFETLVTARRRSLEQVESWSDDADAGEHPLQVEKRARWKESSIGRCKRLLARRQSWVDAIKAAIVLRDLQPGSPQGAAE